MAEQKDVCLVVGVGDGLGSALAKAFAAEGHTVCMTRRARNLDDLKKVEAQIREAGGVAHAYGVDARSEDEMVALFETIERDVGPLEVVVFNIGANVRFGIRETTARVFTKVWEMACFAGFASAKHGLRAVAQSMARELGPQGIHVAHVVIDGAVDGVFIRSNRDNVDDLLADDAILRPDDIAQSFVALSKQPRSAWTHELDVRPWKEAW